MPMRILRMQSAGEAWTVLAALLLLAGAAAAPVRAQPYAVPPTWGGDFWSRPRLTGDWGGLRDEMGKKGVVLDVDVLTTPMDVLSGGRSTGAEAWGNVDYTLNVDTEKLGLWPGGFFMVQASIHNGNSSTAMVSNRSVKSLSAGKKPERKKSPKHQALILSRSTNHRPQFAFLS